MSEETAIVATEPEVEKILEEDQPLVHLVAVDAMQMASSQAKLVLWLKAKTVQIRSEIKELTQAKDHAKSHHWNTSSFGVQINRAEKRKLFYSKLLIAAEAGYTIIPNLPIDLLAIRGHYNGPSDQSRHGGSDHAIPVNYLAEKAQTLPVGDGEYISPVPRVTRWTEQEKNNQGVAQAVHYVRALSLKDMEFPVSVGVPEVMDATAKAMALKVFDQIGISPAKDLTTRSYRTTQLPPARDPDPLIIGQILSPKLGYGGNRPVSFLIAWHLDLRTL